VIVFLDIGSTLIDGPPSGPGQRIAAQLGLAVDSVPSLNGILFQTDAVDCEDLALRVCRRFGTDESQTCDVLRQIWEAQFEESYVIPGAAAAVESLREAGIERVYVSNIWRPFYLRFEAAFPLEAETQRCFPSFRTHKMKPDAELLACICRDVGVSPGEVVMVGDTWASDMAPAIECGMTTIWLLHRPAKEKDDLIRILNGACAGPGVTLGCIGELNADVVRRAREIRRVCGDH
jgi:FMN phosphatase YigB (HAD superfamily)